MGVVQACFDERIAAENKTILIWLRIFFRSSTLRIPDKHTFLIGRRGDSRVHARNIIGIRDSNSKIFVSLKFFFESFAIVLNSTRVEISKKLIAIDGAFQYWTNRLDQRCLLFSTVTIPCQFELPLSFPISFPYLDRFRVCERHKRESRHSNKCTLSLWDPMIREREREIPCYWTPLWMINLLFEGSLMGQRCISRTFKDTRNGSIGQFDLLLVVTQSSQFGTIWNARFGDIATINWLSSLPNNWSFSWGG